MTSLQDRLGCKSSHRCAQTLLSIASSGVFAARVSAPAVFGEGPCDLLIELICQGQQGKTAEQFAAVSASFRTSGPLPPTPAPLPATTPALARTGLVTGTMSVMSQRSGRALFRVRSLTPLKVEWGSRAARPGVMPLDRGWHGGIAWPLSYCRLSLSLRPRCLGVGRGASQDWLCMQYV